MTDIKSSVMSIAIALAGCASSIAIGPALAAPPLPVVQQLDLERYVGEWYEIARYPNFFERMCVRDVTATYARNLDGTISVVSDTSDLGRTPARPWILPLSSDVAADM